MLGVSKIEPKESDMKSLMSVLLDDTDIRPCVNLACVQNRFLFTQGEYNLDKQFITPRVNAGLQYRQSAFDFLEGVLFLRNSSLKLKTVVDNAILLNYAVSSENISESIKSKTENGFHPKANVCIFRRNKNRPEIQSHSRQLFESSFFQFFFCSEPFVRIGNLLPQLFYFYDCLFRIFFNLIRDCCQQ